MKMIPFSDDDPRFFTLKPNVFGGRFFFYFGPFDRWGKVKDWYLSYGLTDIHDRIKDHSVGGLPDAERYDGMVFDPCPGFPLLALQKVPHTPKEIGNLVHEIHHAVQRWTEALGIFTNRDSEEIFAYSEGLLVDAVLDYLWHGVVCPGMTTDDLDNRSTESRQE
jgi:hypothetical protein